MFDIFCDRYSTLFKVVRSIIYDICGKPSRIRRDCARTRQVEVRALVKVGGVSMFQVMISSRVLNDSMVDIEASYIYIQV